MSEVKRGRTARVSDALENWVDDSESGLGEFLKVCFLAFAGLAIFAAAVGLVIASCFAIFGDDTDYGRCLDWHVERHLVMVGKVPTEQPTNVCDVWEYPLGRGPQ